jgi:hypothetical protein
LPAPVDPVAAVCSLGVALDQPGRARCRDVRATWVPAGTFGLMALRPSMTWGVADLCDRAEAQRTDDARIVASSPWRGMPSWVRLSVDRAALSGGRVIDGGSP